MMFMFSKNWNLKLLVKLIFMKICRRLLHCYCQMHLCIHLFEHVNRSQATHIVHWVGLVLFARPFRLGCECEWKWVCYVHSEYILFREYGKWFRSSWDLFNIMTAPQKLKLALICIPEPHCNSISIAKCKDADSKIRIPNELHYDCV